MTTVESPQPVMTEAEADRRLGHNSRDGQAAMAKADHRMLAGDHRSANAYYVHVTRLALSGVTVEREDYDRAQSAVEWLADRFRQAIVDGLAQQGISHQDMHPRFAKSLAIMFGELQRDPPSGRYPQLPNTYFYPDLPLVEFARREEFEWCEAVEAGSMAILAEAEALLGKGEGFGPYVKRTTQRPQGDVHGMLEDTSWSTLDLTDKGAPVAELTCLAPGTWDTITGNAPMCDIPARAPSVMFSLLRAGSRIPPHTGMINTRYICHLPLIVPGNGGLRVGGETRAWEFGKLLLFDDTVEHEAWNDATSDRLVLIFDIWRPEISLAERDQIRALFRAVDAY